MPKGPIILIDDDPDDHAIMKEVIEQLLLPNELVIFESSQRAFEYLSTMTDQPFIILCDINMPQLNGIQLKAQLDQDPVIREKSIPFVYYSTASNPYTVKEAYRLQVQGYFLKPHSMEDTKSRIKLILDYWTACKHPNN